VSVDNGTTRPPKPTALKVLPENIPQHLKDKPQWVIWRYDWVAERKVWAKVPYNVCVHDPRVRESLAVYSALLLVSR
jgi:hypothetical protein